jgi:hypothetical protein
VATVGAYNINVDGLERLLTAKPIITIIGEREYTQPAHTKSFV